MCIVDLYQTENLYTNYVFTLSTTVKIQVTGQDEIP